MTRRSAARGEALAPLADPEALLGLLERAITASADADALLAGWSEAAGPRRTAVREGLAIRVRLAELEHELADIVCDPGDEPTRERAKAIVTFYGHLLKHAADAQFSRLPNSTFRIRSERPLEGGRAELVGLRNALEASLFGTRRPF